MVITQVKTSCGCTASEWPKEPIGVGETSLIEATYNAAVLGNFNKSITVYTDSGDQPYMLFIKGPMKGYTLQNSTLPNPMDLVLLLAQKVFPLDYVLYAGTILFFILCTLSGLQCLGIWIPWYRYFQFKMSRTSPRALILACLVLILILMALNVVMFSLLPDYTMYGDQHYISNSNNNTNLEFYNNNGTIIKRCR